MNEQEHTHTHTHNTHGCACVCMRCGTDISKAVGARLVWPRAREKRECSSEGKCGWARGHAAKNNNITQQHASRIAVRERREGEREARGVGGVACTRAQGSEHEERGEGRGLCERHKAQTGSGARLSAGQGRRAQESRKKEREEKKKYCSRILERS